MARREADGNNEKYVVSDENGYYVLYTNDHSEARERLNEGNEEIRERGEEEGSYAIGTLTEEGYSFDI